MEGNEWELRCVVYAIDTIVIAKPRFRNGNESLFSPSKVARSFAIEASDMDQVWRVRNRANYWFNRASSETVMVLIARRWTLRAGLI